MVKQEEGGTEEEVVTPINADTLGGKLTANNVIFYEEEMVDEFGQAVLRNADLLENHPASYFATSEELINGTLKMDLLWENASPSNAFEPQIISLDLNNYSFVKVIFNVGSIGDGIYFVHDLVKTSLKQVASTVAYETASSGSNNPVQTCGREVVEVSNTEISFGNGFYAVSIEKKYHNGLAIPRMIWGVK